jgi:hypothetical protein
MRQTAKIGAKLLNTGNGGRILDHAGRVDHARLAIFMFYEKNQIFFIWTLKFPKTHP